MATIHSGTETWHLVSVDEGGEDAATLTARIVTAAEHGDKILTVAVTAGVLLVSPQNLNCLLIRGDTEADS